MGEDAIRATADNRPMHLIVPFAAPLAEAGRDALRSLSLPGLRAWLTRCAAPVRKRVQPKEAAS